MISATAEGRQFTYQGSIERLFKCRDRLVLVCGPARSGKTRGVLEKAVLFGLKYARSRILLIRKTRASMSETVLQTLEDDVLPEAWRGDASRSHREKYTLPNGSEIVTGGMDHSIKIMSSEYDLICIFEATELTEEDFEKLLTRLSGKAAPYQQLIADCNPAGPNHFLKKRCDAGRMTYIASTHKDNPRWWDADAEGWTPEGTVYISSLDELSGHRKARLRDGVWAAAEGLVYPEFNPAVHVIDAMPEGWKSWRRVRSIDFGFTNPFVCGWFAIDPDGRMYLYREIYQTGRTVGDHAAEIRSVEAGGMDTVADHDAEDRATLAQCGIPTVAARKDIAVGLQAVRQRLRVQGDGKPRLYFLSGATLSHDADLDAAKKPTSTLSEIDGYLWARNRDGSIVKEVPIKENDHGMDMLRYAVMFVDNPEAPPSVSWVASKPEPRPLITSGRTIRDIDQWFDEQEDFR